VRVSETRTIIFALIVPLYSESNVMNTEKKL